MRCKILEIDTRLEAGRNRGHVVKLGAVAVM